MSAVVALLRRLTDRLGDIDAWRAGLDRLRRGLGEAWPRFRASRLALLVFLCGAGFLLVPSQTRDLMAKLPEQVVESICFVLAVFCWSSSLWYWARWSLNLTCGAAARDTRFFSLPRIGVELPRWLAVGAALVAAFAAWRGGGLDWPAGFCLIGAGVVYLLCYYRSKLPADLPGWRLLNADQAWLQDWPNGRPAEHEVYAGHWLHRRIAADLKAAPFSRSITVLLLLLGLVPVVVFAAQPAWLARTLGAPAISILGLAVLVTLFSVPVLGIARHTGLPVLLLGLVLGGLLAATPANNHALRRLGRTEPPREDITEAARRWLTECAAELPRNANGKVPVVLVGTAGGASRAALWTTTVLDRLAEQDPHLHGRTFAISGVSGGSLGAAVWSALLAEHGPDCTEPGGSDRALRAEQAAGVIDQDYLAAPMGGLFLTDVVWRHLSPLNLLLGLFHATPDDRAADLEKAWEWGYRRVVDDGGQGPRSDRMADSFHALWRDGDEWRFHRPLLFLNGTVQSSGLPIVTAPVKLPTADFPASHDLIYQLRADLRLSTAVTASARFPYITPEGQIRRSNGRWRANVVDGGYFDNLGSGTLTDVAHVLLRVAHELPNDHPLKNRIDLVVVQISSDPDRTTDELGRCGVARKRPPSLNAARTPSGLDAPLAPLLAVTATQSAHTVRSATNLVRLLCDDEPWGVQPPEGMRFLYTHFRLCAEEAERRSPPLNWTLPQWAVKYIRTRAMEECGGNPEELRRYRSFVGIRVPPE